MEPIGEALLLATVRRVFALVASTALFITACGGGASTSEAVASLMEQGVSESVAECVVASLAARGFSAADIVANDDDGEAVRIGLGVCLTDEDLPMLLGVNTVPEVRALLAQRMADSGSMSNSEAVCIVTAVEAQGFSLVEIGGFTSDLAEGAPVAAALSGAQRSCAG